MASNEFIITGRGGLPPSPYEPLSGDNVLTNWTVIDPEVANHSSTGATNSTRESAPRQIVEINGWTVNNKGEVVLTAQAPNAALYNFTVNSPIQRVKVNYNPLSESTARTIHEARAWRFHPRFKCRLPIIGRLLAKAEIKGLGTGMVTSLF